MPLSFLYHNRKFFLPKLRVDMQWMIGICDVLKKLRLIGQYFPHVRFGGIDLQVEPQKLDSPLP